MGSLRSRFGFDRVVFFGFGWKAELQMMTMWSS